MATAIAAVISLGLRAADVDRGAPGTTGAIAGVAMTEEAGRPPIRATIDPAVCGSAVPNEVIVVDGSGRLANVVVTVAGVKAPAADEVLVSNDKCRFVPRVSLLRPGGTVRMTSRDPVLHTMHAAAADGRAFFNVGIPMPSITLSRTIDRPGVVTLTCSTHTWMRGYLHVTDERSAVTDAAGAFRLDGIPAGTYDLRVWHEVLKAPAPVRVTVTDGETTSVKLSLAK